jgi:hypothetical protein
MATVRYEVPPGGGFYIDVPGVWQGGEVIEVDEDTREVRVIAVALEDKAAVPPAGAAGKEA